MKKPKKITQLDIWKGVRKLWTVNPITKIVPNKRKQTRPQIKRQLRKDIRDEIS